MPCGCKKGSGVYIHGGGYKKKKRRRRKKKKGGAFGPRVGGFVRNQARSALRYISNQPRRTTFLPGVTWKGGSGMGFSGAGMAFNGAGLRGKRLIPRRGGGKRLI